MSGKTTVNYTFLNDKMTQYDNFRIVLKGIYDELYTCAPLEFGVQMTERIIIIEKVSFQYRLMIYAVKRRKEYDFSTIAIYDRDDGFSTHLYKCHINFPGEIIRRVKSLMNWGNNIEDSRSWQYLKQMARLYSLSVEQYRKVTEKCVICGWPYNIACHHIIPKSKGGGNYLNNYAGLCPNHHALIRTAKYYKRMMNLVAVKLDRKVFK